MFVFIWFLLIVLSMVSTIWVLIRIKFGSVSIPLKYLAKTTNLVLYVGIHIIQRVIDRFKQNYKCLF